MTSIDERYGRTRTNRTRNRWLIGAVAAGFVVVFTAWVIWGGLDGSSSSIDVNTTKYTIVDAHSISVTYEVTTDSPLAASCAVEALNEDFAIVGWKVVDLAASEKNTRSFTEVLRTSQQSVSGLIYSCWPT